MSILVPQANPTQMAQIYEGNKYKPKSYGLEKFMWTTNNFLSHKMLNFSFRLFLGSEQSALWLLQSSLSNLSATTTSSFTVRVEHKQCDRRCVALHTFTPHHKGYHFPGLLHFRHYDRRFDFSHVGLLSAHLASCLLSVGVNPVPVSRIYQVLSNMRSNITLDVCNKSVSHLG